MKEGEMRINYLFLIVLFLVACSKPQQEVDFLTWSSNQEPVTLSNSPVLDSFSIQSQTLYIDTIYRSMQGPYTSDKFYLETEDDLIWVVGYTCKVIDAVTNEPVSYDYLCHNNLSFANPESYPWVIKTQGTDKRLFTLTAGQTKVMLPEDYGIPVHSDRQLEFFSQALNHNDRKIGLNTKQEVTIYFYNQRNAPKNIKPVYQQAVFVTKQIGGPEGGFNEATNGAPQKVSLICGVDSNSICQISYPTNGDYNPYYDDWGRSYSGHWNIPVGKATWTTNVTNMLNLKTDSKLVAIGCHVHPFSESLEFWDATDNRLLHSVQSSSKQNRIGLAHISYANTLNISLDHTHQFGLKSLYNCTDSTNQHTAMATLFLYLEDN